MQRHPATMFCITMLMTSHLTHVVTTAFNAPTIYPIRQQPHSYVNSKRAQRHICNSRNIRLYPLEKHASTSSSIEISQVQSNTDVLSLADLRYQEWMIEDEDNDASENASLSIPSQSSFRLATAEIYQERKAEGATVFLAKLNNDGNNGDGVVSVVGAAELSPIETRGCITYYNADKISIDEQIAIYATDVVTSSSHRRLGIGSKLMTALEDYSRSLGCELILLHVEDKNNAAINFYRGLGYLDVPRSSIADDHLGDEVLLSFTDEGILAVPTDTTYSEITRESITVKTKQLAINAGTVGQLLMVKRIIALNDNGANNSIVTATDNKSKAKSANGFHQAKKGFDRSRKNKSKRR